MTQLFDANELFEGIKSFEKNLLFIQKGERKFFCLAMPLEFNGKKKAAVPVQGSYKGQPNKNPSFIVRAFEVPLQSNGNPDWVNAKFVALVTNSFVASKLYECFQPGSMLDKRPNLLPDDSGKVYLFRLQRPDKNTEFTTSSIPVEVPQDLYAKAEIGWQDLIDEFNGMQEALTKKFNEKPTGAKEEVKNPWD
jgi:hypothetical protein